MTSSDLDRPLSFQNAIRSIVTETWSQCKTNALSELVERLRDEDSSPFHVIQTLDGTILHQAPPTSQAGKDLKESWIEFYSALRAAPSAGPSASDPIQILSQKVLKGFPTHLEAELGVFQDTDLLVFPDDASDMPPSNGIKQSEFELLKTRYALFLKCLRVPDGMDSEIAKRLRRDIRMILSRPTGRKLIYAILEKMSPSNHPLIRPGDVHKIFLPTPITPYARIDYSLQDQVTCDVMPNGTVNSFKAPSFILLAHELIHYLHSLNGEFEHPLSTQVLTVNSTPEEMRSIHGRCAEDENPTFSCHPFSEINENTLRAEFRSLFQRKCHIHLSQDRSPRNTCLDALGYGLDGIAEDTFDDVSYEDLLLIKTELENTASTPGVPHPRQFLSLLNGEIERRKKAEAENDDDDIPVRFTSQSAPPYFFPHDIPMATSAQAPAPQPAQPPAPSADIPMATSAQAPAPQQPASALALLADVASTLPSLPVPPAPSLPVPPAPSPWHVVGRMPPPDADDEL